MRLISSLSTFLLAAALPVAASATPSLCAPLTGADSAYYAANTATSGNCNTIITVNSNGTLTVTYPNLHPYDGNDDNYVGIINNSASAVSSITLSSNTDIFGFHGDGIDDYGIVGNAADIAKYGAGAYGGPNTYFTNINSANSVGTVNFITPLAAFTGTGYFSPEEAPSASTPIIPVSATPEPSSFALLGTGLLGVGGILRRRWLRS